jgi:hypothetical protein
MAILTSGTDNKVHAIVIKLATFIIAYAFFALVVRQVFAAPIRAYIPAIWYVPDVVMFAAIIVCFPVVLFDSIYKTFMWLLILVIWPLASMVYLNQQSVLFAYRLVAAIMISYAASRYCRGYTAQIRAVAVFCVVMIIASVIWDNYIGTPWRDISFEGITGTKSVSRDWWLTSGVRRIAGFGISSTDTALLLACLFYISSYGASGVARTRIFILIVPAGYAMYLTQQRASLICFIILAISTVVLPVLSPRSSHKVWLRVTKAFFVAASLIAVLTPFIFQDSDPAEIINGASASLTDRTMRVWPATIARIASLPEAITGNGLGSAGEAMQFTNSELALPPDNIFLFSLVSAGAFAALLSLYLVFIVLRAPLSSNDVAASLAILTFLTFNGISANILGGMAGAIFFGYAIGGLSTRKDFVTGERGFET